MYTYDFKITTDTQEMGKVCLWTCLLKNNQMSKFFCNMYDLAS